MARRIAICVVSFLAILALVVTGCAAPPPGTGPFGLTIRVDPPGSGTATFTGRPPFGPGTRIPVRATANPGYMFAGWTATAGRFINSALPSTNFTMPNTTATITANFGKAVFPTGAMIGELVVSEEKSPMATVTKIKAGSVHLYLRPGITSREVVRAMVAARLPHKMSYGAYRDIRYNPVGPLFGTPPKLNPFSVPAIREAMNWLWDRSHVRGEFLGGMGAEIFALPGARFVESSERYPDILANIRLHYRPRNATEVLAIITPHMLALNATWHHATRRWHWAGREIVIRILIRSDLSPFPRAGDYVADQLERIGFTTVRRYVTAAEAAPIWFRGDPADGLWHVVTGGWGMPTIPSDQAAFFATMQTQTWFTVPLWKAYEAQLRTWDDGWPHHLRHRNETYYDLIMRLHRREFSTMAERRAMFERAMWGLTRFSAANLLVDVASATPYAHNVDLIVNKAAGVGWGWTQALHFHAARVPVWRDRMMIEQESQFVHPWNPVEGSNWVYDLVFTRYAMRESGLLQDPVTGLYHPSRIRSAAVTIANALPVKPDSPPWLNLTVLPAGAKITVPADAWAGWDAAAGRWITAAERFPIPADRIALRKSVVVYPDDVFAFPMHDNSTLSLADFLMSWILPLDIGQNASAIFEPARAAGHAAVMATFRGIRITSVRPLTVEFYSNAWAVTPHGNVATLFPSWLRGGSNPWHMISIGWLAARHRQLAFGTAKADDRVIPWMDFTKGPSLPILATQLANVRTPGHADHNFIPYRAAIEAAYTTHFGPGGAAALTAEIATRYANLAAWHARLGHFWVDMGLYYLHSVRPIERVVVLRRFAAHPDPSDRWMRLLR